MKRAINQPTRGKAWDFFMKIWTHSLFGEGSRRGILVTSPKYHLNNFWLNHSARQHKEKWFRSRENEDSALKCVRSQTRLCVGFMGAH